MRRRRGREEMRDKGRGRGEICFGFVSPWANSHSTLEISISERALAHTHTYIHTVRLIENNKIFFFFFPHE